MTEVHGLASANQTPRYQAQYKGGAWHVFDAALSKWHDTPHETARMAQEEANQCALLSS